MARKTAPRLIAFLNRPINKMGRMSLFKKQPHHPRPGTGRHNSRSSGILHSAWGQKLLIWGMLFGLFAGISGLVGLKAYNRLCRCDFFMITGIKIQGNQQITRNQVLELSGIDFHTNLLAMRPAQVEALLEGHPWVARARITRNWPNDLLIDIRENIPVALTSMTDGLYYLNSTGEAFVKVTAAGNLDYPVITGLAGQEKEYAEHLLHESLLFMKRAQGNTFLPKQNISEIHIDKDRGAILFLADRAFPIYLGKEKTAAKYDKLVKVLKNLYKKNEFQTTAYINMDYMKDRILVGRVKSG